MKHLHKFVLFTCLLLPCGIAVGQAGPGFPSPAFHWKCPSSDSLLNFHPATVSPLRFDSIPYAEDYTVVAVYKPVADTEAVVWRLVFADSTVRVLTTERILSDSTAIRYAEWSDRKPAIHTLRQSAPDIPSANVSLSVGDGNAKVSEVLYFDRRLSDAALRRVQSALAIRYGITLGPVDYVGGNGHRVWQHRLDSAMFHHRITGIGSDTACNLRQLRSRSEMDGAVVTLSADSLPMGAYLLLGDNDAPLTFRQEDGDIETLARQWRIQSVGAEDAAFSLAFDLRDLPAPADSLVLVLDGSAVLPSAVTDGEVRFDHLWLTYDTGAFTLARGALLWQLAQSGGAVAHGGMGATGLPHVTAYPNPTTGRFAIEVADARRVRVTVYDLRGRVMASFDGCDRDRYLFEGTLPSGSAYYATVATENGTQTMKLVVK